MATVARPKLSRKELKQPDEFISILDQSIEYVSKNVARVILGAVGLVAILAIIFGIRFYWQHQQQLAAEQFYQAVNALNQKDYKTAAIGFSDLAQSQPGSDLGHLSGFYLGSTYLGEGQPAKARDAINEFLQGSAPSAFTQLALCQLGVANENLNDFRQAQQAYARAAAIQGPERSRAELSSARMLAKLGDKRGAIAAYQSFMKENPFAMERPDVIEALANLGAAPEVVPLTAKTVEIPAAVKSSTTNAAAPNSAATPAAAPH
jgi:predicted negative regulator of RcsB-dependent stress response